MSHIIRNNEMIPARVTAACGAEAVFDEGSGCGYRCVECGAMLGSVGMPSHCKDEENKVLEWKILKGEKLYD